MNASARSLLRSVPIRYAAIGVVTALQMASVRIGAAGAASPPVDIVDTVLGLLQGVLLLQRRLAPAPAATVICALYGMQCAAAGLVLPAVAWAAIGRLLVAGGGARVIAGPLALSVVAAALGVLRVPATGGGLTVFVAGTAIVLLGSALAAARAARRQAIVDQREAAVLNAATQQRLAIARDLHDSVGHGLSVIAVQSGTARLALDAGRLEAARTAIAAVEAGSRQALREMRQLVLALRVGEAGYAPAPGIDDLPGLVDQVPGARLTVQPGLEEVPDGVQLTVYRLVQEGLTNAVRHAPGSQVTVDVRAEADDVVVQVVDGGGTGPSGSAGAGAGLLGLRERVSIAGGRFSAGPGPGGAGWQLVAQIPRHPNGAGAGTAGGAGKDQP